MKKEKQVKSYQRRTKSGKMVTVKAHTAKYEAADKAKEMSKKAGAGKEFEERKNKPVQLEIPFGKEEEKKVLDEVKDKEESVTKKEPKKRPIGAGTNGPEPKSKKESKKKAAPQKAEKGASDKVGFTAAEFKEWYRGTGSAADKKVAKALREQLGRSGYRKLEDEAIDNYSSRGHLSMFKRVSGGTSSEGKGVAKTPAKEKHPRNLTDEEVRDKMKRSKKYVFSKDGTIWSKGKNGKKDFQVSVDGYRKLLTMDYNEQKASSGLGKYAKEYGFNASDVPTLSKWAHGASKPYRKMSEVNSALAKSYARFEDIPLRTAKLELMMAKPSEYRKISKFHEIEPTEKSSKSTKSMTTKKKETMSSDKSGSSNSKLWSKLHSGSLEDRDKAIDALLASKPKKLRSVPKNMAWLYQYSIGGKSSSESAARKILESMPEKHFNKLLRDYEKRGGKNIKTSRSTTSKEKAAQESRVE